MQEGSEGARLAAGHQFLFGSDARNQAHHQCFQSAFSMWGMWLCAGKDRTGIIVMLLLLLCDVDPKVLPYVTYAG